jgi:hypothetical protein
VSMPTLAMPNPVTTGRRWVPRAETALGAQSGM